MMEFLQNYLNNVYQTPNDYYKQFNQEVLSGNWNNTTQLRTIKEQTYPFESTYTELEAWVDTVSDVTTNTTKIIGDYISLMFKDIDHPLNHRGQKYLYKADGVIENTYLCYDKLNPLTQIPDFKCIKCNNKIKWVDKSSGKIITEPIFIGWELSATNNNITKDSTIEQRKLVCLIQGNEYTKDIVANQRFLLSKNKAFKVTQNYDINLDDINEEYPSLMTLYIEWSTLSSATDNIDLLVADYYALNYAITIKSSYLELIKGATGHLIANVTLNNETVTDVALQWSSNDVRVVTIDNDGNYSVIGEVGSTAYIMCSIVDNENVSDSIMLSVIETPVTTKTLIVYPNGQDESLSILQDESLIVSYGVYYNNTRLSDTVTITSSGAPSENYTIRSLGNSIDVNCLKKSMELLTITFTSGDLSESIEIDLMGMM